MSATTMNQLEALPLREATPASAPAVRRAVLLDEPEAKNPISTNGSSPAPAAPVKKNRRFQMIAGAAVLTGALALGNYYVKHVAPFESTDDAFIEAHVTPIAPQVAGRVARLLVSDNQEVKQGDLLLEIDPSDYQAKLDQAEANLAAARSGIEQANAQTAVDKAKVGQEKANIIAVAAEAKRASADYKRYQAIGNSGVSDSQLQQTETDARSAEAQVDVARNKDLAAEAQVALDEANIQTASAQVQRSQAAVRQAQLDLSYTRVTAQESGYVTRRTVEQGAYVQPGQSLLAIVPKQVWVVANFKETQLNHMTAGQPVNVTVDAYPQINFKGHVDSIQSGAGARFSLLPPENASGNYVKVVQRVPVKIVLDDAADSKYLLGPGMSVVPEVRVR